LFKGIKCCKRNRGGIKVRKFNVGFTILSLVSVLVTGCGIAENSENGSSSNASVKIGLAAPLSGSSAEYGEQFKKGAELAVQLVNDSGGINGKKVVLDIQDDKGDPKEAANTANKFVSDKSILAVVGHFNSSATLAAAPIYNKNKVVEISPSSSSPKVTDAGDYTFRVITTDAYQAQFVANWTKEEGYKKAAIVYEQTDFGLGLSDVYSKIAKENGIEMVAKGQVARLF
jgi:branched-chain amino acid transport system substrate-binding protein